MTCPNRALLALLLLLTLALPSPARAEEEQEKNAKAVPRYNLRQLVAMAQLSYPGVEAARQAVKVMEAKLYRAKWAWLPQATISGLVAPAPEVRCMPSEEQCIETTAYELNSLDIAGALLRVTLDAAMPLYTFDKIGSAKRAAKAGVKLRRSQVQTGQDKLAKDVARREEAEALLADADHVSRFFALSEQLDHGRDGVRLYAANQLVALRDRAAVPRIAAQLVRERERDLRVAYTQGIATFENANTAGVLFVPFLKEKKYQRRYRALQAMAVFRDRRTVRYLIEHFQLVLSGFGTATYTNVTQRAYIKSWKLVSGGTATTVVEVPDPEIDVLQTGVTLEVRVRRVELNLVRAVLEDLTGQSFGADVGAWALWYKTHPDFPLAPH